jgi:hypothetical protein
VRSETLFAVSSAEGGVERGPSERGVPRIDNDVDQLFVAPPPQPARVTVPAGDRP